MQTVTGVVSATPAWLGAHPTDVDDPVTHASFDFLVNVKPDSSAGFLLGTGNFAGAGEAEEAGRLHTEWEQAAFPAFAWPSPGDRVQLTGNWVWDCGHWQGGGERTELHPLRAFWVQRQGVSPRSPAGEAEGDLVISTDGTPAGASANCQHRTRGDTRRLQGLPCSRRRPAGRQRLIPLRARRAPAPEREGAACAIRRRRRRLDRRRSGRARRCPGLNGAVVTVTVSGPAGRRVVVAKRVFVGWDPPAPKPVHLRVTFDRILVRRSMDPGCIAPCTSVETTRVGQISKPPGEWTLYSNVAGVWSQWPLLRPVDGQTIRLGRSVDVYLGARQPWRLVVTGRECDNGSLSARSITTPPSPCPAGTGEFLDLVGDDAPGVVTDAYASPRAAVGAPRNRLEGRRLVVPAGECARLLPGRLPGRRPSLTRYRVAHARRKQQKDVVTRLSESGEEALQRFLQNPGTAKVVGAANALKERVDELTRADAQPRPAREASRRARAASGRAVEAEADDRQADDGRGRPAARRRAARKTGARSPAPPASVRRGSRSARRRLRHHLEPHRRRSRLLAVELDRQRLVRVDATAAPRRSSAFGWGRCVPR